VAFLVFLFVTRGRIDPIRFWRNAASEANVFEKCSEVVSIIRLVGKDCDSIWSSFAKIDSEEIIVAIPRTEEYVDDPSLPIDQSMNLCVGPTTTLPNTLSLRPLCTSVTVFVNLAARRVNRPQFAPSVRCELC